MAVYENPRSPKIREFIRTYFLSWPLWKTKNAKDKVLDLGCGWGFYFKINPLAFGVDTDQSCLNYLKKQGYKAVSGDLTKRLPFENNSFKWVVCHDVLEHFTSDEEKTIFQEVQRILEPNGRFLILIPNKKGYEFGISRNVGHKHYLTPKEIPTFTNNNFIIEKKYSHPLPRFLGKYFTHNKEVIILKKIK